MQREFGGNSKSNRFADRDDEDMSQGVNKPIRHSINKSAEALLLRLFFMPEEVHPNVGAAAFVHQPFALGVCYSSNWGEIADLCVPC